MIYEYEVEIRKEDGALEKITEEAIIKSIPICEAPLFSRLQRRFFCIVGDIDKRFCLRCHAGIIEEIDEKDAGFWPLLKSLFRRKPRKVFLCNHCGIVHEKKFRYGYEILESLMAIGLKNALRAEPDGVERANAMSFQQQLEVFSMWLGIGLKQVLNYGSLPKCAAFYALVHGEKDEKEIGDATE